jgi:hypothetical protein
VATQRIGESREDFLERERQRWHARKRVVNSATGAESTTWVPEREGYEPLIGGQLARRSTLVDDEGKVVQQWVIEKPEEKARQAALEAVLAAFKQDHVPFPPIPAPMPDVFEGKDLLTGYPIGDHHMGMLAWWREVGQSYDLDIGETLLLQAVDHLVERSEPARYALVASLGDFFHYDSMNSVTPEHGNILDADGRAAKMVRAGARALMRTIERAAEKHQFVHVICEGGNHDPYSTIWLMELLRIRYENNPRITIDNNPSAFHYYRFGANLIGTHHGDKTKLDKLPLIMATDRSADWGETTHRVWWTGHTHDHARYPYTGCDVEVFPILPPPDAYAHSHGWRSKQKMMSIVFHREDGEVSRYTFKPSMLGGQK